MKTLYFLVVALMLATMPLQAQTTSTSYMDLGYSQPIPVNGTPVAQTVNSSNDLFIGPGGYEVTGKPLHFIAKAGALYEITIEFNTQQSFDWYLGAYVMKPEEDWTGDGIDIMHSIFSSSFGNQQVVMSNRFMVTTGGAIPIIVYDWSQNDYSFSISIEEIGVFDYYTGINYPVISNNQASGSFNSHDDMIAIWDAVLAGKGHSFSTVEGKMYAVTYNFQFNKPVDFDAGIIFLTGGDMTGDEYDNLGGNEIGDENMTEASVTAYAIADGNSLRILVYGFFDDDDGPVTVNYTISIKEMDAPPSYANIDYTNPIAVDGTPVSGSLSADEHMVNTGEYFILARGYSFNAVEGNQYLISIKFEAAQDVDLYAGAYILGQGALQGNLWYDPIWDATDYDYGSELMVTGIFTAANSGVFRLMLGNFNMNELTYTITVRELSLTYVPELNYAGSPIPVDGTVVGGEFNDYTIIWGDPRFCAPRSFEAVAGKSYRITCTFKAPSQNNYSNALFWILDNNFNTIWENGAWFSGEGSFTGVFTSNITATLPVLLIDYYASGLTYTISIEDIGVIKHYYELDYNATIAVNGAQVGGQFTELFYLEEGNNPVSGAAYRFQAQEGVTYKISVTLDGLSGFDTRMTFLNETLQNSYWDDRLEEPWLCWNSMAGSCERSIMFTPEVSGLLHLLITDQLVSPVNYTMRIETSLKYTDLAYSDVLPVTGAVVSGSFNVDDNSFAVWYDDLMVGKDFIFTAAAGMMYEFSYTMTPAQSADNIGSSLYILKGGQLSGEWSDIIRREGSWGQDEATLTFVFIPEAPGDYRILLEGSGANVMNYTISVTQRAAAVSYINIDYTPLTPDATISGNVSEAANAIVTPENRYATGKGYVFWAQQGKTYQISCRFTSDGIYNPSDVGFFLIRANNEVITRSTMGWFNETELTTTLLYNATFTGDVRILLYDESLRDVGYTLEVKEVNLITLRQLLDNTTETIQYTPELQFADRGILSDNLVEGDGNLDYMYSGNAYYAQAYKMSLSQGDEVNINSRVENVWVYIHVYYKTNSDYERVEFMGGSNINTNFTASSAGDYYFVVNSENPVHQTRYYISLWGSSASQPANGLNDPEVSNVELLPYFANVGQGETFQFAADIWDTYGASSLPVVWSVIGASAGTSISETGLLTVAGDETASDFTVRATASNGIFGEAQVTVISYSISASQISSFGALQTPYTQPAAQTVTITNTGNGAIDLQQPTANDYDIGTLSTTTLPVNGATATFTVRPKAALAVGTHNETITIIANNNAVATVDANFTVSGTPTYNITASPPAVSFGTLTAGYSRPAAQMVTITNAGDGAVTLTQPAGIANYEIGTLSTTALPNNGATATFTVQPNAGLSAGTHDVIITITGTNGTSATVNVSFTVTPALTYTITAAPQTLPFGVLSTPYARPSGQTVTITNTGTGTVTLEQPVVSANYEIGALSTNILESNATATFTVRPVAGLPIGDYSEIITISGNGGASATVIANFEVIAPLEYSISAAPVTVPSFGILQTPYTQPAAQTITITNTGTGAVTLTQPTATNYDIGALSATTLAVQGSQATFTVRPKAGLAVGTYNEAISIIGDNLTNATVNVSFQVISAPTYTISASPSPISFGSFVTPYTQPVARTVTITNTGSAAVTLEPLASVADYEISALSTTTLSGNGSQATFTVRPNAQLPAGTYNRTITINGNNGATATVEVTFEVTETITYSISASSLTAFSSMQIGYATAPPVQIVTITNTGSGAVTLTQPTSTNYDIGALSTTSLPNSNSEATFTVRPKTGLVVGTYDEAITINGNNGATATVNVSFEVTAAPLNYTISVAPTSIPFGALQTSYTQPGTQLVTITNTGTGAVTLQQPTGAPNYDIGALSTTHLATGATATFTVRPKADLATGNYNETITISGNDGATATVEVTFEVTAGVVSNISELATANPLRAWMRNGLLHVEGLTIGEPLSVFSINGTLVYQSIAANEEADIQLSTQGVYIVVSGKNSVRVVYEL